MIEIKLLLTVDPLRVKISKRYSYSYDSFSTRMSLNVYCQSAQKLSIGSLKFET